MSVEERYELLERISHLSCNNVSWIGPNLQNLANAYGQAGWERYNSFCGVGFTWFSLQTVEARQNGTELEIDNLLHEMVAGVDLPTARIKLQALVNSFASKAIF